MFGQPSTFGSPPAAAGGSAFGQPAGGAPGPFGTPSGGGAFGAPAAPPATGGVFGAPAAPAFGSPAFGTAQVAGGAFGAPAAAPATGAFGAPAAAAGGGMFGSGAARSPFGAAPAPAPAATGAWSSSFGGGAAAGAQTGAFGSTTTSAFGAANTSPFGAPAAAPAATGLFGAPSTTPAAAFGSAPAAPAFGGFGAAPAASGSSSVAYTTTNKPDSNSGTIVLRSISAMPAFEKKSPEEIRWEDYQAGNRGTKSATVGGGAFGQAPTAGAFGAAPAPAASPFGFAAAPAPAAGGLFGAAPAPAAGAFGGFGAAPAPAAGGLFGAAPAPATGGLFGGAAAAPAPAFGGFGAAPAPAAGGLFGAPAPAAGGLFGAAPAPAPSFGGFGAAPAPVPAAGGLFGSTPAPAPAAGGLFGAAAPAPAFGGFGATPAPAAGGLFGVAAPAPAGGLFGGAPSAPAPAFGGFGAAAAPAAPVPAAGGLFGSAPAAPAPAGGLFGSAPAPFSFGGLGGAAVAPAPTTGGLFGTAPAGGLFGAAPAPAPAPGGIFGAAPAATGGLFGQAPTAGSSFGGSLFSPSTLAPAVSNAALLMSNGSIPTSDETLAIKAAAVEEARRNDMLVGGHGGLALIPQTIPKNMSENNSLSYLAHNSGGNSAVFNYNRVFQPRSKPSVRPRGMSTSVLSPSSILGSSGRAASILSPEVFLHKSANRLVIKPESLAPRTPTRLLLTGAANTPNGEPAAITDLGNDDIHSPVGPMRNGDLNGTPGAAVGKRSAIRKEDNGHSYYDRVVAGDDTEGGADGQMEPADKSGGCTPSLINQEYIINPSVEQMSEMNAADLAAVTDFTIFRPNYGKIEWIGAVDVRKLDVDKSISIEDQAISVYLVEEAEGNKPDVGSRLNRPAVVTIYKMFPKSKGSNDITPAELQKYERKVARQTEKMNAELISFDAEKGEWCFRTQHFSRYAFDDDSDTDDEEIAIDERVPAATEMFAKAPPAPPLQDGNGDSSDLDLALIPGGKGAIPVRPAEDLSEDASPDACSFTVAASFPTRDDKNNAYSSILKNSESAYRALDEAGWGDVEDKGFTGFGHNHVVEFEDDFIEENDPVVTAYVIPKPPRLPISSGLHMIPLEEGICATIARECGVKSSSKDYSIRMGRSFRVAWHPNGSLICPGRVPLVPASTGDNVAGQHNAPPHLHGACHRVLCKRPVLTGIAFDKGCNGLEPLLQAHLRSTVRLDPVDGCPMYTIPDGEGSDTRSYNNFSDTLDRMTAASKTLAQSNELERGEDRELAWLPYRAFSLLRALFGQVQKSDHVPISDEVTADSQGDIDRRRSALLLWFGEAVANDAGRGSVGGQDDPYDGIFSALCANDLATACRLATDLGCMRLATVLSSGITGPDVYDQMLSWDHSGALNSINPTLSRIYTLLAGDLNTERMLHADECTTLDWRQSLFLRFSCSEVGRKGERKDIRTVIDEYMNDVREGSAPKPRPRFVESLQSDVSGNTDCILFKILSLRASMETTDSSWAERLMKSLSPCSYTYNPHDYSLSFHLASLVQKLGLEFQIDGVEWMRLCQSYAAQLVAGGMWQWAVYVLLNAPVPDDGGGAGPVAEARLLIARYFVSGSTEKSLEIRRFLLEDVGVPLFWLDEASMVRDIYGRFDVAAVEANGDTKYIELYEDDNLD